MTTYSAFSHPLRVSSATTEQSRQRLVSAILAHAAGAKSIFSSPREYHYLEQFRRGRLTIDEVVYYLESTVAF
ncbi:MAG: hypothetical protein EOO60_10735 [Hymenobacter sp.]|nr:MAG: hypothetical protein EOO60_10735 [Hymenobacter sp.]